jgi:hypothetical protein
MARAIVSVAPPAGAPTNNLIAAPDTLRRGTPALRQGKNGHGSEETKTITHVLRPFLLSGAAAHIFAGFDQFRVPRMSLRAAKSYMRSLNGSVAPRAASEA